MSSNDELPWPPRPIETSPGESQDITAGTSSAAVALATVPEGTGRPRVPNDESRPRVSMQQDGSSSSIPPAVPGSPRELESRSSFRGMPSESGISREGSMAGSPAPSRAQSRRLKRVLTAKSLMQDLEGGMSNGMEAKSSNIWGRVKVSYPPPPPPHIPRLHCS